jgi:hypothetical protein
MELWEILVPTKHQNGKPIRTRFHRVWDAKVRSISNGLTVMPPTITGQWISPSGALFHDRMIPIRFMVEDSSDACEIIDMTLKYYSQKAVMAYRISDLVIMRLHA